MLCISDSSLILHFFFISKTRERIIEALQFWKEAFRDLACDWEVDPIRKRKSRRSCRATSTPALCPWLGQICLNVVITNHQYRGWLGFFLHFTHVWRVFEFHSDLEKKVADLAKSYEKLAANYGLGSFKPSRTASYSNLNEEMLTGSWNVESSTFFVAITFCTCRGSWR